MADRRTLTLTEAQRAYLEGVRDRDKRAYLRERAAALLKIAAGASPHQVARTGLLKPRKPRTLYTWLNGFEATGALRPRPPCRRHLSPRGRGASADAGSAARPAAQGAGALDTGKDAYALPGPKPSQK